MKKLITANVPKELQDEVSQKFKEAGTFRKYMRDVLEKKREEKVKSILSVTSLNEINFQETQIDRIAYARALEDFISWLED